MAASPTTSRTGSLLARSMFNPADLARSIYYRLFGWPPVRNRNGTGTGGQPPWLMLPPEFNDSASSSLFNFYTLAEKRVINVPIHNNSVESESESEELAMLLKTDSMVFVGSSHGWLAVFDRRTFDLFLFNPLSGRRVNLPKLDALPLPNAHCSPFVPKLILSCSPDDHDSCRALMCFGPGARLCFCRPGVEEDEWTLIGDEDEVYEDIVYSAGMRGFFCVARRHGCFELWDLNGRPEVTKLEVEVDEENYPYAYGSREELDLKKLFSEMSYLVAVGDGEFFLVRRYVADVGRDGRIARYEDRDRSPHQTKAFDVYRYEIVRGGGDEDGPKARLRYVEDGNLDGLALFVGINHSFAVVASDELNPDSIYFTDGGVCAPYSYYDSPFGDFGGHDIGIYNYRDRTFESCYYSRHVSSIKNITPKPIWFAPSGPGN